MHEYEGLQCKRETGMNDEIKLGMLQSQGPRLKYQYRKLSSNIQMMCTYCIYSDQQGSRKLNVF